MQESPKDFFISYSKTDQEWAEWIAWQLEQANYSIAHEIRNEMKASRQ